MKITYGFAALLLILPVVNAQSDRNRDEIAVTVEARDVRDDGEVRYYLTLEGTGITDRALKQMDAKFYPGLRELDLPGKVGGPLLTDRIGQERTEAGYFWQGVRVWHLYNADRMSERQIDFYRRQIEASTPYQVRPFRYLIEEMDQDEFERVEAAAISEARRQADRIARSRDRKTGEIIETEWLNSEVAGGAAESIRLRVVFALR